LKEITLVINEGIIVEWSGLPDNILLHIVDLDIGKEEVFDHKGNIRPIIENNAILIKMKDGTINDYSGIPNGYQIWLIDEDVSTNEIMNDF